MLYAVAMRTSTHHSFCNLSFLLIIVIFLSFFCSVIYTAISLIYYNLLKSFEFQTLRNGYETYCVLLHYNLQNEIEPELLISMSWHNESSMTCFFSVIFAKK